MGCKSLWSADRCQVRHWKVVEGWWRGVWGRRTWEEREACVFLVVCRNKYESLPASKGQHYFLTMLWLQYAVRPMVKSTIIAKDLVFIGKHLLSILGPTANWSKKKTNKKPQKTKQQQQQKQDNYQHLQLFTMNCRYWLKNSRCLIIRRTPYSCFF